VKKITTYYGWALVLIVLLAGCNGSNKKMLPPLHKTFDKEDALPFGAKIAYQIVEQAYPENTIQDLSTEHRLSNFSYYDTSFLYLCMATNVYASKEEAGTILNSAYEGNTYFISAENISTELLDTLGVRMVDRGYYGAYKEMSNGIWLMDDSYVKMAHYISADTAHYGYFFYPLQNSFVKFDAGTTRVLGVNEDGDPDFIVVFCGKGRVFLHCEPCAFSNYFLLHNNNYRYLRDILALLPANPDHIYWDDYFYQHNYPRASGSGIAVLLKYPPMKWAFWLSIILLMLYIIFGGKRRQRIIPILSPMKNTTVAYTETMSRLYLQKKDNRNIADKMITFFFEYIRNQFFLNTSHINDDFIETLSRKSSVPKEITATLFKNIASIQEKPGINDQDVLLLNKQIETFFKNRK
jgi:hypothetical protein